MTRLVALALLLAACGDDVTVYCRVEDSDMSAVADLAAPTILDLSSPPDLGLVERCLYFGYDWALCQRGRPRECVLTAIECGREGGRCCVAGGCWSDSAWCDPTDFVCKRCL